VPIPDDTIPTWLKIASGCVVVLTWLWALLVSIVRPWNDERWYGSYERQGAKVEKHLRTVMFERDLKSAAEESKRTDALEDSTKGLAAAQLAQGEMLKDIPQLSRALGELNGTLRKVDSTLTKLEEKVDYLADGHNKLSGVIEAWRDDVPPIRPRRKRAS
jgi:chromosome segregation ATPase